MGARFPSLPLLAARIDGADWVAHMHALRVRAQHTHVHLPLLPRLQGLPPTYEAHLSGLPGFTANADYSVTAIASKTKSIMLGIGLTCVPPVLSPFSPIPRAEPQAWTFFYFLFGLPRARAHRTLTTPFIYYPRTAPARGIPPRLEPKATSPGLHITPEWRVHESPIAVRLPGLSKSIICKFYTPASHVVCMRRAIPYHITFTGPGLALTTLLTYMPSRTGAAAVRACSRIQLIRQTSVDAKCVCRSLHAVRTSTLTYVQPSIIRNEYAEVGATSEMWRTRCIGDGSLCRSVRQINFLLPVSAYVGAPVAMTLTCFY
jgi:hypothetical protein